MYAQLRRRVIMAGAGSAPAPAVMIPYIRGGADNSYIDTGITPDQTTKVVIWARNWNPAGTSYVSLFGSLVANNDSMFYLAAMNTANTGSIRVCYGSVATILSDKWTLFSHYHKYEFGPDGFYVDDILISAVTAETFSNNYNIQLFGTNTANTHGGTALPIDIAACKIYKNGSLVRDYTAVETPSVGLYDAVSDTVFTNAGSGSFTYGTFDANAYTPLEYIEDSNASYFDTGANGGYNIPIVSKFRYTNNDKNVTLLGYRGSSDWCEFDINYGTTIKMYYRLAADSNWRTLYNASSSNFKDKDIVLVKTKTNAASLYRDNTQTGSTISPTSGTSYVTSGSIYVGALNNAGSPAQPFTGRIYFVGIGSSRNYVPAKVGASVGMYDTYNDVFKKSESSTPFTAGPTL